MPLWGVSILLPATPRRRDFGGVATCRSDGETGSRPCGSVRALDQGRDGRRPPASRQREDPGDGRSTGKPGCLLGWGLAVAGQVAAIATSDDVLETLLRRATPADDPILLAVVPGFSGRIGLRRPPKVVMADDEARPSSAACGARHWCSPRGLAVSLDPGAPCGRSCFTSWPTSSAATCSGTGSRRPPASSISSTPRPTTSSIAPAWSASWPATRRRWSWPARLAAGYAATLVEVVSQSSTPPAFGPVAHPVSTSRTAPRPSRYCDR